MNVDSVVLDVDGVLVDVADSYRRAIVESLERVYDDTIDREGVQAFKDAGGFNDDWELTYAAALYVLARQEGYPEPIGAFADRIADRGGGLAASRPSSPRRPSLASASAGTAVGSTRPSSGSTWGPSSTASSRRARDPRGSPPTTRGTSTTSPCWSSPTRSNGWSNASTSAS
jgi:hypothetical protein